MMRRCDEEGREDTRGCLPRPPLEPGGGTSMKRERMSLWVDLWKPSCALLWFAYGMSSVKLVLEFNLHQVGVKEWQLNSTMLARGGALALGQGKISQTLAVIPATGVETGGSPVGVESGQS
jgi:hypothetical protein